MRNLKERRKQVKQQKQSHLDRLHLKEALEKLEEFEAHVSAIKRLQNSNRQVAITQRSGTGTSEALAISVASDWHIGQEVTRSSVNGLNEFNVAIGRERGKRFFERTVRLTNKERQDVDIHELLLFLGGDFIEGSLHLDTIMGSDLAGAMNQVVEVQAILRGGLNYLKQHGNYKKITIVCCDGNHGRISTKQHFHSRRGNSLEYYMYYNLAHEFPEFSWVIDESMLSYVPVYSSVIRFMHGDRIAFGGVNGFYTYLHRRIYEWDTSTRADFTVLGHLHQYTPNRRYLVNGCLVGYNSFAQALGAKYEPPTQAFMLWDKKRGPSVHIPILL